MVIELDFSYRCSKLELCWKLECDPQSCMGQIADWWLQKPEPLQPQSLYQLSSGQMEEFLNIEYDNSCGYRPYPLRITYTELFDKLTRKQRTVVLANLWDILRRCDHMRADEHTLCYIKTSFSGRLNILMQLEGYPGDFGQHEGTEQQP